MRAVLPKLANWVLLATLLVAVWVLVNLGERYPGWAFLIVSGAFLLGVLTTAWVFYDEVRRGRPERR